MACVFCVEDDSGIRELITCALQSGGYTVEGFGDGRHFFRRLAQEQPDLILLDIMLPEEDGITLLKRLKAEALTASIPVIVISAKSSEIDKVTGLENGADDYIVKPFGIMEMLSRVKAVLRRSGGGENVEKVDNTLEYGGLTLDLSKRKVTYGEVEIALTYKEFELFAYLMRNRQTAVSRERLLEEVWGFTYEGETRTVDAHIRSIRQKLEVAGAPAIIQTVWGYGYKVDAS